MHTGNKDLGAGNAIACIALQYFDGNKGKEAQMVRDGDGDVIVPATSRLVRVPELGWLPTLRT